METSLLHSINLLRALVGYLGEKDQYGWWQSAFFVRGSQAFLTPVFPRTPLLAQVSGVIQAAALVHDEHIGLGSVYHLFRLPEELEQALHRELHRPEISEEISSLMDWPEAALAGLGALELLADWGEGAASAGPAHVGAVGPLRWGGVSDLYEAQRWRLAAGLYMRAFQTGVQVYPYFADRAG